MLCIVLLARSQTEKVIEEQVSNFMLRDAIWLVTVVQFQMSYNKRNTIAFRPMEMTTEFSLTLLAKKRELVLSIWCWLCVVLDLSCACFTSAFVHCSVNHANNVMHGCRAAASKFNVSSQKKLDNKAAELEIFTDIRIFKMNAWMNVVTNVCQRLCFLCHDCQQWFWCLCLSVLSCILPQYERKSSRHPQFQWFEQWNSADGRSQLSIARGNVHVRSQMIVIVNENKVASWQMHL